MAFLDLVSELTGTLPGLSPLLAETYINRAWKEIRNERSWSFFVTDGVVICPAIVTTGSVAIVQGSPTITLDATASAAMQDQITGAAEPGILQLQLRLGASSAVGPVYSVVAVDNTNPAAVILTVHLNVIQATNAASPYQIYRCYVIPPYPDFKKWEDFVDMANAITLTGVRNTFTSAQIDIRDPQRMAQGLAYNVASWGGNRISNPITGATSPNATVDAGTPIYELWPHPTNGQNFYVRVRRSGEDFIQPTDEQPDDDVIPNGMIIQRALGWHAYAFAAANVANFPQMKTANWLNLILNAKAQYAKDLIDAKRNDNEKQLQDVWSVGHGLRRRIPFGRFGPEPYIIDSNYLQSHLVRF